MRRQIFQTIGVAATVAMLGTGALAARREAGERPAATRTAGPQSLVYGTDPLQVVDFWPAAQAGAPLVVFVHGGGWKRGDKQMMRGSPKPAHWQAQGYAVASVNYRLVPAATVEQQAADVAAAVALLQARAQVLGIDGGRIALVGHSAGAHLVALVGTDPQYLRGAGLALSDVRGVVPLDGAAYDVAQQMVTGPRIMRKTYAQAFGSDPARQAALSPTVQAAAPNVADFLVLHVEREDGTAQSEALARALRAGGSRAEVQGFAGKGLRGHAEINRDLGDPAYPATPVVDAFLARVFR